MNGVHSVASADQFPHCGTRIHMESLSAVSEQDSLISTIGELSCYFFVLSASLLSSREVETFTCQGLSAQETLVWPSHTLNSPGGKSWSDPENLSRGTKLLGRKASIWGFQRETGKFIYVPPANLGLAPDHLNP